MSDHPATVSQLRRYVIFCFAAVLLFATGLQAILDSQRVHDQRAACGRTNARNVSELHQRTHIIRVNRGRVRAATVPAERRANRVALAKYSIDRAALVASVQAVASDPSAEGVDRVLTDCSAAYPYAWPARLWRD